MKIPGCATARWRIRDEGRVDGGPPSPIPTFYSLYRYIRSRDWRMLGFRYTVVTWKSRCVEPALNFVTVTHSNHNLENRTFFFRNTSLRNTINNLRLLIGAKILGYRNKQVNESLGVIDLYSIPLLSVPWSLESQVGYATAETKRSDSFGSFMYLDCTFIIL